MEGGQGGIFQSFNKDAKNATIPSTASLVDTRTIDLLGRKLEERFCVRSKWLGTGLKAFLNE